MPEARPGRRLRPEQRPTIDDGRGFPAPWHVSGFTRPGIAWSADVAKSPRRRKGAARRPGKNLILIMDLPQALLVGLAATAAVLLYLRLYGPPLQRILSRVQRLFERDIRDRSDQP